MTILKIRHLFRRRKIFFIYFLSYLLVTIIPILFLGMFSHQLLMNTVDREVSRANTNSLKQISGSINAVLHDINSISIRIGMGGNLYTYAKETNNDFLLNDIKDHIKMINNSHQEIHSIQIYFENNNQTLSSNSLTDYYIQESSIHWINAMKQSDAKHIWLNTREVINLDGKVERVITLVRKFPVGFSSNLGYVAVSLYEEKLADIIKEIENNNQNNLYIANDLGEVVSSFNQQDITRIDSHLPKILKLDEEGHFIVRDQAPSTLVTYTKTLNNNWMLISEEPLTYLNDRLAYIKNVTNLIIGGLFLIGIIISYFLSRSMFNPIKQLLEKSRGYKKELSLNMANGKSSDFSFLSHVMDKAVKKNQDLEGKMKANFPMLKERFLFNLLFNHMSSLDDILYRIDSLDLQMSMEYYTAIVIEMDDYAKLTERYTTNELGLYKFALNNIAEEIINNFYPCLCTSINERHHVILVNIGKEDNDWQKEVEMLSENIQNKIQSLFGITLTISIGDLYKDISQAFLSYNEAMHVIKNKVILGDNQIIFFDKVEKSKDINYFYPKQLEINIINNIKIGNGENIGIFLDEIKNEFKSKKNITSESIYRIYSRLLDESIKVLMEHNGTIQQLFGEEFMIYQELEKRETIYSIHDWMKTILLKISSHIAVEKNSKHKTNVDKVIEFIDNHYHEDLSVDHLAELVNLNPSYLSRVFKQNIGKTIVEYLTYKRMTESKKLLSESTLTIKEISERIGYNSVNSYIRFFKKYEGTTPGQYRKSG